MLLRVDILTRDVQIVVIIIAYAHRLCHLVGCLLATQHRASALANADGIAHAVGIMAKHLTSLHQQLVVGNKASADIDNIDTVYYLFRTGDRLKILAFGNHRTRHAGIVGIRYSPHQRIARHNGDAKSAHTVSLHGETALARHGLNNSLNRGTRLHTLIRGQIAYIARTHGQHTLA